MKKKLLLSFIGILSLIVSIQALNWTPIGQDIDGEAGGNQSAYSGSRNTKDIIFEVGSIVHVGSNSTSLRNLQYSVPFGNALHFDGTDDYVHLPANAAYDRGANNFTWEAWFKTSKSTGYMTIIGNNHNLQEEIMVYDGAICYYNGSSNPALFPIGNTIVSDGNWHHVALVREGDSFTIYLDGQLEVSATANPLSIPAGTNYFIGRKIDGYYFEGEIDEVRMWDIARSQASIQTDLDQIINHQHLQWTNLISYYRFDQGNIGVDNNHLGNELIDYSDQGIFGTLNNFALTGYASNWVQTGNPEAPILTAHAADLVGTTSAQLNGEIFSIGETDVTTRGFCYSTNDNPRITDSVVSETGTYASGNYALTATGLIADTTYYFRSFATNAQGTSYGNRHSFETRPMPPGNALHFDGINDAVDGRDIALLNFGTGDFTLEAWIKTSSGSTTVAIGKVGNGEDYWLGQADGKACISISGTACVGSTLINSGTWHHIAGVREAGTLYLYVDGILENTIQNSKSANPTGKLNLGAFGGGYNFSGSIDEVRIWNVAKAQCEIQQALGTELIGNETGLMAYYNFNAGQAGANNASSTILEDNSSNGNTCTLLSFALNGATSNWIASGANLSGRGNYADAVAPVPDIGALPDITAECQVIDLVAPTATDTCSGNITGIHDASLPITSQGTTVVTWVYDDGNGNTSSQTQNIIINDVIAPVADATELPDITSESKVTALTAPTATDFCTGTITGTHDVTLPIASQGTTVVTWTYADGNGNTSSQTQNIVINDVAAPVANVAELSDVTAECQVTSLTAPTATDACTGSITGTHDVTLPITSQGTTVVTWTYADGNGNSSSQTQNIVINDVAAPVPDASELPDVTAECEVATLIAPKATDACIGAITGTHDATLPIKSQGTTVVTWTYADGNGNSSSQKQNIVIKDVTNPDITCLANQEVNLGAGEESYSVQGKEYDIIANDNCSLVNVTNDFNNEATLNGAILPAGTTTITWTAEDNAGNTARCSFDVTVNKASGISELSKAPVRVYPNPTDGLVKIMFASEDWDQIVVSDLTGKLIMSQKTAGRQATVNLSEYPNGFYLITCSGKNKHQSFKVFKQN